MIGKLSGRIDYRSDDHILLDVRGVGYMVYCSDRTLAALDKLEGQYPTLEQMASVLNMSPRTYRRRLEDDDTSFQAILDSTRLKHATQNLSHPDISVDQVAHRLGFSDVSNFRRAFTQWSGQSPTQWRKKKLSSAAESDH